jgi:hypothetical protein
MDDSKAELQSGKSKGAQANHERHQSLSGAFGDSPEPQGQLKTWSRKDCKVAVNEFLERTKSSGFKPINQRRND